jgi:HSP20 family protein
MLMRYDPFRELDRFTEQLFGSTGRRTWMPMDAVRRGDHVEVHFDLPGVEPSSVELTVENDVLTVKAERTWYPAEGDEVLARERVHGSYSRQLLLGEALDAEQAEARFDHGVLTVRIPVAERAKPRRIEIHAGDEQQAVEVQSGEPQRTSTG